MLSFLLELHRMIIKEELMTKTRAWDILKQWDGPVKGSNPSELRAFRRRIMKVLHSDVGGNEDDAKIVNAAIDCLLNKNSPNAEEPKQGYSSATTNPTRDDVVPKWAWAGYSGGSAPNYSIYRENYTDMNYIKKSMYYMSKADHQEEFTLIAFDGHFFRSTLTIYGSMNILQEMANAMFTWNSHGGNPYATRAIFFYTKTNPRSLYLIYSDGVLYTEHPILFEHDSFNLNPGNDQSFVRRLPEELDKLKEA